MLKSFQLALRLLVREWRSGQWYVVMFALLIAIAATTTLNFYTNRLMRGLEEQSAKFLGGDLVIRSSAPISDAWKQQARALQLETAEVWSYPTMVNYNGDLELVNLQAVSDNYPIIGDKNIHPAPNSVWADSRIFSLLGIKLNDQVKIGAATLTVAQVLPQELDSLATGWVIAPRVLINLSDIPATKTVVPGSRVEYQLLLTGHKVNLQKYSAMITPQLKPGQRIISVHDQRFTLRNILQRTQNFIQLILLICIVISGVAIALSIQQYLRRHYANIALWRSLGGLKNQIIAVYLWQLILIAAIGGVIGTVIGYFAQNVLVNLFGDVLRFQLPPADFQPVYLGLVTSILLLFTFSYPVLTTLPNTPPLFLWRGELKDNFHKNIYFILAAIVFFVFLTWMMSFSLLSLFFLAAMLVSIGFMLVLSFLLVKIIKALLPFAEGTFRRGLSQLTQNPDIVSIQMTGLSLILMCIFILAMARSNLLNDWRRSLPADAANYFAINIAPDDVSGVMGILKENNIHVSGIYPMIRGRFIKINNKPVLSAVPPEALNHNTLHRELNLSWMTEYPSDNKVTKGEEFASSDNGKNAISIEKDMADELHIQIGDTLAFSIAGKEISGVVKNVRSVEWTSFHPNFYIIFSPGNFENYPATYITSFYLPASQSSLLNTINQKYPNITIIDVANLLQQIQNLLEKITLAMQYLFFFALLDAALIFYTCIQATSDQRKEANLMLHILGASRTYIVRSTISEFLVLGSIILITAYGLAILVMYFLNQYITTN